MNCLIKMSIDFGKLGKLESLFICTKDELETLYGKTADFGECLGKHSDICCDLDGEDFTILSVESDVVNSLKLNVGATLCGLNPFSHLQG